VPNMETLGAWQENSLFESKIACEATVCAWPQNLQLLLFRECNPSADNMRALSFSTFAQLRTLTCWGERSLFESKEACKAVVLVLPEQLQKLSFLNCGLKADFLKFLALNTFT